MTPKELLEYACKAQKNAKAKYSDFPVGAAILCDRFSSPITSLNKKNIAELSNSWQTKKQSCRNLTFKQIL